MTTEEVGRVVSHLQIPLGFDLVSRAGKVVLQRGYHKDLLADFLTDSSHVKGRVREFFPYFLGLLLVIVRLDRLSS